MKPSKMDALSWLVSCLKEYDLAPQLLGESVEVGIHSVTYCGGRFQVDGGPSFESASECAEAIRQFELDHG